MPVLRASALQTSRQAKKAYQKSGKGFQFTASQERAAARRNAKDEFARKLREKDERTKNNKRKRDEKEEREREAKKRLIEKGRLSEDALLPKVTASQPRLNYFIRPPPKTPQNRLLPLPEHDEDDSTVRADSDFEEDTLVNDHQREEPAFKMDTSELNGFLLTAPSQKHEMSNEEVPQPPQGVAEKSSPSRELDKEPQEACYLNQNDLESQLGGHLSQVLLDFDICEDPLSESEQAPIITPSPLKRKRDQDEFATPSKSSRSALSQMSPGKVLLRSQEKPDTTSAPSLAAKMLSPEIGRPTSSQLAREAFAMIGTQDIADEIDFSPEKENNDPLREIIRSKIGKNGAKAVSTQQDSPGPSRLGSKLRHGDEFESFGDSVFEDFMHVGQVAETDELKDVEDIDEFGGDGICDADWAGLSTQMPKNTAVSTFGSPRKAKALTPKAPITAMAPPPKPSPVASLVQKLKALTPKKAQASSADVHIAPPTSQYFGCDKDMEARMLALMEPPTSSQSFGLDDGMDDEMLALMNDVDDSGLQSTKQDKKSRTLPWQHRPASWDSMIAHGPIDEEADLATPSRCDT